MCIELVRMQLACPAMLGSDDRFKLGNNIVRVPYLYLCERVNYTCMA